MRRTFTNQMRGVIGLAERALPFEPSDEVRALIEVHNEGMYPHREIGEKLVEPGDAGIVREIAACFGDTYYAVEFFARAVVVGMHAGEMIKAAPAR
jgi:nitrogen fixation protein NifZ